MMVNCEILDGPSELDSASRNSYDYDLNANYIPLVSVINPPLGFEKLPLYLVISPPSNNPEKFNFLSSI